MTSVTVNDKLEVAGGEKEVYNIEVGASGRTLETGFGTIVGVNITFEETTDNTTYWYYSTSGSVVTIFGGGTGFTGTATVTVYGRR